MTEKWKEKKVEEMENGEKGQVIVPNQNDRRKDGQC